MEHRDPFELFSIEVVCSVLELVYSNIPKKESGLWPPDPDLPPSMFVLDNGRVGVERFNRWASLGSLRLVSKRWNMLVENVPFLHERVWFPDADRFLIEKHINRACSLCSTITLCFPEKQDVMKIVKSLPRRLLKHVDSIEVTRPKTVKTIWVSPYVVRKFYSSHQYEKFETFWCLDNTAAVNDIIFLYSACGLKSIDLRESAWHEKRLHRILAKCPKLEKFYTGYQLNPSDRWPSFPSALRTLFLYARCYSDIGCTVGPICKHPEWTFNEGLEKLLFYNTDYPLENLLVLPSTLCHLEIRGPFQLSHNCGRLENLKTLWLEDFPFIGTLREMVRLGMTNLTEVSIMATEKAVAYITKCNPNLKKLRWGARGYGSHFDCPPSSRFGYPPPNSCEHNIETLLRGTSSTDSPEPEPFCLHELQKIKRNCSRLEYLYMETLPDYQERLPLEFREWSIVKFWCAPDPMLFGPRNYYKYQTMDVLLAETRTYMGCYYH